MRAELLMFNAAFLILLYLFIKFKEYKSSLAMMYIFWLGTFYIQNIYYYYFNGQTYRIFSDKTLLIFINISTLVFINITILLILKKIKWFKQIKTKINFKETKLLSMYFNIITFIVVAYMLRYINKFPLITLVESSSNIRLDISGGVPHYFTISTFAYYILPSFYFLSGKKRYLAIYFLFGVLSLHKGILVYTILFIWINCFEYRINKEIIVSGILIVVFYLVAKNKLVFDIETMKYLFESSIRRFFITQGSGFIVRLDMLENGFDFVGKNIKRVVYDKIYGGVGGAPTYFLGNLIVSYGYIKGLLIHSSILSLMYFVSSVIDYNYKKNNGVKWIFFSIIFILGNTEITFNNLPRLIAILFNFLIIFILNVDAKLLRSKS
ncbi:MAG: hypothetical protein N4A62_06700 [Marinisporobacter sp.]|jgi:hypothetical protein|nr:hypothetical protein [Marinisporobacter sp.]